MTVAKVATIESFIGLSTDTKPTSAAEGSNFFETNTGATYRMVSTSWVKVKERNTQDVTMSASALKNASGTATAVTGLSPYTTATFLLDVTVDESTSADKFYALIQRLLPDGSTWDTIASFPEHLGNAGAEKYVLDITASAAAGARKADDDNDAPVISPGQVRDVAWGDQLRAAWDIVDASGSAAITFSVTAHFRI